MILLLVAAIFVVLIVFSMPIVFALGVAGTAGLFIGGYDLQVLSSSMVSGSQSWVLLAIPAFVFAGGLMEKCGMSHALVDFARALVGWVKGGLGMSVIVVAYFFSDICGSKMAEVSALGSTLMPPLTKAGYKRQDSASLIAAGTAMGMLVPPAIFMIVIAQVTNTSPVALFIGGFIPAAIGQQHEHHHRRDGVADGPGRDVHALLLRGLRRGIAVHPGADAGKGDRSQAVVVGDFERTPVAGGEQRRLVRRPAVPHRARRVNDKLRRQAVAARDFCLPGFAAVQRAAFGQQLRPRRAMNRAVDPAATQERCVGGIDDGVDV